MAELRLQTENHPRKGGKKESSKKSQRVTSGETKKRDKRIDETGQKREQMNSTTKTPKKGRREGKCEKNL